MAKLKIPARAKLNLTLDIVGRRPDGYHNMKMLMQTVELSDWLEIENNTGSGIELSTNLRFLPRDEKNLAIKASKLFFEVSGVPQTGLRIALEKRVPVTAGLGGGSADAAAMLRALNFMYGTGYSEGQLREMGLVLGADVPFCVVGGTMLAEGVGERLTPQADMPYCHVVLCKPQFSISTPSVFQKIDGMRLSEHPDTEGMLEAIRNGCLRSIACRLFNVMEAVSGAEHSEIRQIKSMLIDCGALGAVMSGSGPTVYGLFDREYAANTAYQSLRALYTETHKTSVCGKNRPEDISVIG